MPVKTGHDLNDPVGAIARMIKRDGSDFSFGKPGPDDFVRGAVRLLALEPDAERDERIAEKLFLDMGVHYVTEAQVAAFLYAELTDGQR